MHHPYLGGSGSFSAGNHEDTIPSPGCGVGRGGGAWGGAKNLAVRRR